jgi:hypothetical protein
MSPSRSCTICRVPGQQQQQQRWWGRWGGCTGGEGGGGCSRQLQQQLPSAGGGGSVWGLWQSGSVHMSLPTAAAAAAAHVALPSSPFLRPSLFFWDLGGREITPGLLYYKQESKIQYIFVSKNSRGGLACSCCVCDRSHGTNDRGSWTCGFASASFLAIFRFCLSHCFFCPPPL